MTHIVFIKCNIYIQYFHVTFNFDIWKSLNIRASSLMSLYDVIMYVCVNNIYHNIHIHIMTHIVIMIYNIFIQYFHVTFNFDIWKSLNIRASSLMSSYDVILYVCVNNIYRNKYMHIILYIVIILCNIYI